MTWQRWVLPAQHQTIRKKQYQRARWQKGSDYSRLLLAFFYDMDPSKKQAVKLKQIVEEGWAPCRNIFREMKKQKESERNGSDCKVHWGCLLSSSLPSLPFLCLPLLREQDQLSSSSAYSTWTQGWRTWRWSAPWNESSVVVMPYS